MTIYRPAAVKGLKTGLYGIKINRLPVKVGYMPILLYER